MSVTFMSPSDYEQLVLDLISELTRESTALDRPPANWEHQNKRLGASGFSHQIDVSLKTERLLILIECKYWKDPVDVEPVLVMASRLADLRAANSMLEVEASIVSTKPSTSGAQVFARYFGVQLDVVSTPKEYALRIRDRFFLGKTDLLPTQILEHAEVIRRDLT